MGSITQVFEPDYPITYQVAENVVGGQLIEGRASSLVGVAAAGSTKVLGVALYDAIATANQDTLTYPADGSVNESIAPVNVAVGAGGGIYDTVTYAAAATFGQKLIAAAAGKVTPAAVPAADASAIVGECREPAGVAAGATGLTKIY